MPIKVPDNLPAKDILLSENVFIMNESRAFHQDIRPLKIVVLNLMPKKQDTEVQLLRILGNSPLQIETTFLHMESHVSKNTSMAHLETFYKVFDDVKNERFDGMIITGAPVEQIDFNEVNYWKELSEIMEWTKKSVTSTLHICWAAQAGLYYHYGIEKHKLDKKMFGVFAHHKVKKHCDLMRGFDDIFYIPHSRHTYVKKEDIERTKELEILAESDEAGVCMISDKIKKNIFILGHAEYDKNTLKNEYFRDKEKGLKIDIPKHYFKNDDPSQEPIVVWKSHSNLLYQNWLNYYVYQLTPYEL